MKFRIIMMFGSQDLYTQEGTVPLQWPRVDERVSISDNRGSHTVVMKVLSVHHHYSPDMVTTTVKLGDL